MTARIGLLVGREEIFPAALIDHINGRNVPGVTAEIGRLSGTRLDQKIPYAVILDRISHEVPYYRAYLTKAAADGVIVVNNPFWWSADNKFIECVIAERLEVAVPRTVLLPNVTYEADIIEESLRNLVKPLPWQSIAEYVGLPAVIKPALGGGSKNVSIVNTVEELVAAHQESGNLTMIVQECIEYENYARCWVIGREEVRVSGYDYHKPRADRYRLDHRLSPELFQQVEQDCLTLTRALGYDMDTVELAIRDGIPYAIDFLNPAPDCDPPSVGQQNFEWVVEHVADLLIRYATGKHFPAPEPNALALVGAIPQLRTESAVR